jgi:glycosyltransferase involved in cell wall biosynthesis
MESLKPLLDNVNCELIILDTVGPKNSDGSIEICRKYTDKIYRFEWINDFSAARNELLHLAKGEWFMYQDDDEWFDDVTEFINFFNSSARHKYNSGFYYTKDYVIDGSASTGIAGRMIRRRPDTHFEGRVHEHFNEANLPGKQFECFTHHQGYVYETEEQRLAKAARNLTILEAEMEEKGLSPERCAQKVQELMNLKDRREEGFRLSVEYSDKLIEKGLIANRNVQWMIVVQARYFHFLNDGERSIKQTAIIRNKYKLSHFAMLALACTEAEAIVAYTDTSKHLTELENDVIIYKICEAVRRASGF